MKITKEDIKKIIAEELRKELISEASVQDALDAIKGRGPIQNAQTQLRQAMKEQPTNDVLRHLLTRVDHILGELAAISSQEITDPTERAEYVASRGRMIKRQAMFIPQIIDQLADFDQSEPRGAPVDAARARIAAAGE